MSIPDPTAETLPTPPNPYRFTVEVSENWVDLVTHDHDKERNVDMWRFLTREEAEHHASLILSALHQATRED